MLTAHLSLCNIPVLLCSNYSFFYTLFSLSLPYISIDGVTRKIMDDRGWAEKQSTVFTQWLNFMLVPQKQRNVLENSSSLGVGCVETLRSEARMRQAASSLIRRDDIASVRATLNQKINSVSFVLYAFISLCPPLYTRPRHRLFTHWFWFHLTRRLG